MPAITLDSGCTVTLEAIDVSTGANVTGVTVSLVALYGVNLTDDSGTAGDGTDTSEPPWFVPIPVTPPEPVTP
jgi:hypothetical protein